MKTLIVEDDFTSRLMLQELLRPFGSSHIAVSGREAMAAVGKSLQEEEHYDLICLDIILPGMDGQQALEEIRGLEESHGITVGMGAKVLMTSSLSDKNNVMRAFRHQCDGYLIKPIEREALIKQLYKLGLITSHQRDGGQRWVPRLILSKGSS